jgi:isopentenyl diphosphate isomerase/L-lactate dehydrogenase-like FMN-dependent dehydrogenase
MDVDSAGLINLKLLGKPVDPKSPADIKEIVRRQTAVSRQGRNDAPGRAHMPGRRGLRHRGILPRRQRPGGRPPTCSVLPEIRAALGPDFKIFVDGGIRSGADVFKALALGADAVLIGRPYTLAALAGGAEGVQSSILKKYAPSLSDVMVMTGCASLSDITRDKVRLK